MKRNIIIIRIVIFLVMGTTNLLNARNNKELDGWLPRNIESQKINVSSKKQEKIQSILYFKNGIKFQTTLYEVKFIGLLKTINKSPYLILSGKGCNHCDMNTSIYIHSISNGPMEGEASQGRYSYPSKEYHYKNGSLVGESRAFFGKCLSNNKEQVVWHITSYKDAKRKEVIYVLEIDQNDNLTERIIKNMSKLSIMFTNTKLDICEEIEGMIFTSEP